MTIMTPIRLFWMSISLDRRSSPTTPTTEPAGQAGNENIEDGDDAADDGVEDGTDGINNGHEASTDGAEDTRDLLSVSNWSRV